MGRSASSVLNWLIWRIAFATGKQIIPPTAAKAIVAPITLVDLCQDDSDLHEDAVFLDQLGEFLSDAGTAKTFCLTWLVLSKTTLLLGVVEVNVLEKETI